MAFIPYPNVPAYPGVPAIPRSPNFPPTGRAAIGLLAGAIWRVFQVDTRWGVFDKAGKPLADPSQFFGLVGVALETVGIGVTQSTSSVEYGKDTAISEFPIERGSFASYNKVERPAAPTVTLALQGTEANRRSFLDAIDAATKSTELYSIVTPEKTYVEYAIESYNYQRRASKGATLLIVELNLREIRQVSAQYATSNRPKTIDTPKDPGATPSQDGGKVQPQVPRVSVLKGISDALPGLADEAKKYLQGVL